MADILKELGVLAIGTRLRRMSDLLIEQVAVIYENEGIEFNPRFFPLLSALATSEVSTVVELSKSIGISHSAVVQTLSLMKKERLVDITNSISDSRKTEVRLTSNAKKLSKRLQEVWDKLSKVLNSVINKEEGIFMDQLENIEKSLKDKSLINRMNENESGTLEILEWDSSYRASFRDLNIAWISHYFGLEPGDEEFLGNPDKIIKAGGMIFFARLGGMIVGTAAMLNKGNGVYELARMAVSSEMQGRGIGRKILNAAILWGEKRNPKKIYLETSKKLKPALALYEKAGFKEIKGKKFGYGRADTYMEYQMKN